MEVELEGGYDAEVAAAAPYGPEKVGVLVLARVSQGSIGGHNVNGPQVVARESIAAGEPAEPAAERESGDSRGRVVADWGREAERLRLVVELGECAPRIHASGSRDRIDLHRLHRG